MSYPIQYFPFNNLNDTDFIEELNNQVHFTYKLDDLNKLIFNQFELNHVCHNQDVDPNLNFFVDNVNFENFNNCNYYFTESLNLTDIMNNSDNCLSMMNVNINSIPKNLNNFLSSSIDVLNFKFDILTFCETKINDDIDELYTINGYQKFTNNNSRNSGGLAIFIKDNFSNVIVREDLKRKLFYIETLFIEFKLGTQNIVVGVIYRRPNSNINDFLENLDQIVSALADENKIIYLMGDININLLNYNSPNIEKLIGVMHGNNLFNVISKPTRVARGSATLIDHIWTNNYNRCLTNGILYDNTSDHFPIFSFFNVNEKIDRVLGSKMINYRVFNDDNINNFKNDLQQVDWSLTYSSTNSNVAYNNFILIFKSLFEKNFPLITKQINLKNSDKPYITPHIKSLIKEKNRLQNLYAKWPITYGNIFRQSRNKLNEIIRIAKNQYYKNELINSVGDPRRTWKVINNVMNRKSVSCDKSNTLDIDAECFNNHFSTVGEKLNEKIIDNNIDPVSFLGTRSQCVLSLSDVSEIELLEIVAGFGDAAAGCDDIPMSILKKVIHTIKLPLLHIFNNSLSSGIFPNELKISKVCPIFKHGKKTELNNYRPISILPSLSKIIEKLLYNRLEKYLNDNNLLSNSQYGFRKHRSTTSAIIELNDHVLKYFDKRYYTAGIFLDFKKAFDCVNHEILLKKLEHYGIRDVPLKLLNSYLHNRYQFTQYNGTTSTKKILSCSVPQGSILGPLLFNIYINDLTTITNKLKPILFADDSCFYYSNPNVHELISVINNEMINVSSWLTSNRLTLNHSKSHYMIFNRKLNIPLDLEPVILNNKIINKVTETTFLGLIIQQNLKWNGHIKSLANKINKYSSIIFLIRNSLDNNSLKLIYNTLVYSNLVYANVIWGNSPRKHIQPLITAQKKVLRTIKFRNRYYHTNADFYNSKILKLVDINKYFASIFTYKSLNDLTYPVNYFNAASTTNTYTLRNTNNLRPPLFHSTQSQLSPSFYCCNIWNNIPQEIKSKPSVASFKFAMKNLLIENYNHN